MSKAQDSQLLGLWTLPQPPDGQGQALFGFWEGKDFPEHPLDPTRHRIFRKHLPAQDAHRLECESAGPSGLASEAAKLD